MGIWLYDMKDTDAWNKIAKGFTNYDVYYLAEYSKAFQINGDGEPVLFYYEDDKMKAMNVVIKRDISQDERFTSHIHPGAFFDISTPYGYGGFLYEGEANNNSLNKLNDEYCFLCKNENIVSEIVRFHPVLNNVASQGGMYDISILGKTVTMDLDSKKNIWNSLTSKNRNVIRKAQKHGVEIYQGRNPELFEAFRPLYNKTMDKDAAKDYYYFDKAFYNSVLSDLRYNSSVFYAEYEKRIIAMSIIIFAGKQMHYHLSTTDIEYQWLAPNNLLLYEAACWGSENGFCTFHLGGGLGSSEDSLFKFKSAFNKESDTRFSIGRKVFDRDKYKALMEIREMETIFDTGTTFFPEYRK